MVISARAPPSYSDGMWKQRLAPRLALEPDLIVAYLFGSHGRGTADEGSDVDIGIWLGTTPTRFDDARYGLAADLEEMLGKHVDLVVMNSASPDLIHRILRDGEILVENDRSRRIKLEVQARNQYFDTQPLRAAYRRAVLSR